MSHRKMPPHPRGYGIDKKGDGARKVRKAWRKWGKADACDQAADAAADVGFADEV